MTSFQKYNKNKSTTPAVNDFYLVAKMVFKF